MRLAARVVTAASVHLKSLEKVLAGNGDPRVIWLQGRGRSGCSVSLLDRMSMITADALLRSMIDLEYHSTLIAAAGDLIFPQANGARPHLTKLSAFSFAWLPCRPGPENDTSA
jgi:Ni,Fe-hydrogenase I small subunit